MINKITQEELNAINWMRKEYCNTDCLELCSVEYLLRFWKEKIDLYELLGKNLIIEFPIKFTVSQDALEEEISRFLSNNPVGSRFISSFRFWLNDLYNQNRVENVWNLCTLINCYSLASNRYEGDTFTFEVDGHKALKIQHGCKTIKALKKISEEYNITNFEEFRLAHSLILNQKEIEGTLCLSIHPLDYITMSDNNCDWTSCMSWVECGEYRQGTIEMMNSNCVVVAYIKSAQPYTIGELDWSNKKWRELFIINKEIISEVKSYPYENSAITAKVIELLKELAEANWGISTSSWNDFKYCHGDKNAYFYTNCMYNDFGSGHLAAKTVDYRVELNYSGPSECMACGSSDVNEVDELVCCDCSDMITCCCCCDKYERAECEYIDGQWYCDGCAESEFGYCGFCKDRIYRDDLIDIFIRDENDKIINDSAFISVCSYCYKQLADKVIEIRTDWYWHTIVKTLLLEEVPEEYRSAIYNL